MEITREQEINKINKLQNKYIQDLLKLLDTNPTVEEINFTSPTGTGKSKMIAKLINSEWGQKHFFIITTLSRGELNIQIDNSLSKDCNRDDFIVYGSAQLSETTILRPEDVQEKIMSKSKNRPIIWIRDEAHIQTNSFKIALKNICEYTINFSATNEKEDVVCDFSSTCMLRTPVILKTGDVSLALDKLIEIKEEHKIVPHYNPCAVFRCINNSVLYKNIIKESEKRGLKWIDLNENNISMSELCKDDNEYDVIINKMKIVEGVDLKRAHIMYLGNVPENNKTIIQFAGRARRNALLWREDFDIFNKEYTSLFNSTRNCFIYFNVNCKDEKQEKQIEDTLRNSFRDIMSIDEFVVGAELDVINGVLSNGMTVYQLKGQTGSFVVEYDDQLQCKVVNPLGCFYDEEEIHIGFIPKNGYKVVEQELWGKKHIGYYDLEDDNFIPLTEYNPYVIKNNDYESAGIGSQYFKYINDAKTWIEIKSVSDFLDKTSSNAIMFIDRKYEKELKAACDYIKEENLSSGANNFNFNKICNKCLGWLVEFYAKYLIFGRKFLFTEIKMAQKEANTDEENEPIIFYACFLKYKELMKRTFGNSVAKFIKGPSISDYIKEEYQEFVSTVISLATKTKEFLIDKLKLNFRKNDLLFDENLSIKHFSGKADFICEDTIIDLKTTNNITKRYIRQVLFYHYLSTKRSDLNIKRVIVYDCVSGNYVEVKIEDYNLTTFFNPQDRDTNSLKEISKKELNSLISFKKEEKYIHNAILYGKKIKNIIEYDIFLPTEKIEFKAGSKQELAENALLELSQGDFINLFSIRNKYGFYWIQIFSKIYKNYSSVRDIINRHISEDKGVKYSCTKIDIDSRINNSECFGDVCYNCLLDLISFIEIDNVCYGLGPNSNVMRFNISAADFNIKDINSGRYDMHKRRLLVEKIMKHFNDDDKKILAKEVVNKMKENYSSRHINEKNCLKFFKTPKNSLKFVDKIRKN